MTKLLISLLFTLVSSWADSPKKLRIGTFLIPRFVKSSSEGDFIRLISTLASKSHTDIEIVLIPPKRAYKELNEGKIDGLFPAMESKGLGAYEKTSEFYVKEMFVYQRAGHDFKNIQNAKVCVTEGYTYPEDYIKKQEWVKFVSDSDGTCLKLLDKKRVDLFIGEKFSASTSIERLGLSETIIFNKYSPVSSDGATLIFRKNKIGKNISEKFDKALKEIMMDRSYYKIISTGANKVE